MLKRLRLKDFKSFVDAEVRLAPLTLLLGANASGKSNFLDALQFLHANSFDLEFEQILNGEPRASPGAWRGLRGGASEAARAGTSRFTIESDWALPVADANREWVFELTHQLTCRTELLPLLEAESLIPKEGAAQQTGRLQGDRIEFDVLPFGDAAARPETRLFSARQSIFLWPQKSFPAKPGSGWELILPSFALLEAFSRIDFWHIQPSEMRGNGRRNSPLGNEGRNLSGVLAHLCEDPGTKRTLVDWLIEFCAPEIVDIEFVDIKEVGEVIAMLVEKGGRRVSVRSASDGTLRFLGTLLALRLAPKDSVLLLDEIDSGLHPTRIRLLVEYLETVTRERGIQVIASTHSPVILQWLSQQTLRDSLVFGRVPEHEGTLVRRLGDLPHFDEVAERKSIEELFTTGWMEMAL